MAVNLLPSNMVPSAGAKRLVRIVNNIATLFAVTFVFGLLLTGGFFVYNGASIRNLDQENDVLRERVKNLEEAEQTLFLIRDRLSKIQKIMDSDKLSSQLQKSKVLGLLATENSSVDHLDIEASIIKMGVSSNSSSAITDLLESLEISGVSGSIRMDSLSFNQNTGFSTEFTFRD